MKPFYILLLMGYLLSRVALASEVPLNSEIFLLEEKKKNSEIKSVDILRLAELYFLSSRCSEIKGLFVYSERLKSLSPNERETYDSVVCACGGFCSPELAKTGKGQFLLNLKKLSADLGKVVEGSKHWKDKDIQEVWKKVSDQPEAQYLVYKSLKAASPKERSKYAMLLAQLEADLESYEVK